MRRMTHGNKFASLLVFSDDEYQNNAVSITNNVFLSLLLMVGNSVSRGVDFTIRIAQLWIFLIAALLLFYTTEATAYITSDSNYSIDNLTLISKKRINRVSFDYTYTVDINSTATDAANINITVSTTGAGTTIIEQDLDFGVVKAGATSTSNDTFTLRQDRRFAFDAEALIWTIQAVELTDQVAPIVFLTVPKQVQAGTLLSASAQAMDNIGVEQVNFYVDGLLFKELTEAPFVLNYNTLDQTEQILEVRVVATDAAGNEGEDVSQVPVVNAADTEPPEIIAINLPSEAAAGEQITIQADVTDNHSVDEVQFSHQDSLIKSINTPPFQVQFTVPAEAVAGETLSIDVQASDGAGNAATKQAQLQVAETPDNVPPEAVTILAPATALPGQLLDISASAVDNVGVFKVQFIADGAIFYEDYLAPYTAQYAVPKEIATGASIAFKVNAVDFSANQTESNLVETLIEAPGEGFVIGEIYNDSNGLSIAGAVVSLLGEAGQILDSPREMNTDDRGRFRFTSVEGTAVLQIRKDGMSRVYRNVEVLPGEVVTAFDARLTPLATSKLISPTSGAKLSVDNGAIELEILPGAFSESVDVTLTPLSGQGLPGLLPIGWSPLAAVFIGSDKAHLNVPLALSFNDKFDPQTIAVHWHKASQRWLRLTTIAMENGGVQVKAAEPGGFALVRPDAQPAAPPVVEVGKPLIGVVDQALPDNIGATITPNPDILFMQPGVHSDVTATLQNSSPLSSGTPLVVDFSEDYQRTDGAHLNPYPSSQDIVLYQTATGFSAEFTASPSEIFDPALLQKGLIHLEARNPKTTEGLKIIGTAGGTVTAPEAINLEIPAGALSTPTPVQVNSFSEPLAELNNDPRFAFLTGAGVEIGTATLNSSAVLRISMTTALESENAILLLRAVDISGITRLELVGIATLNDNSIEVGSGGLGLPLPGIRTSGRYYLVQMKQPVGYLTGQVSNNGVAPQIALVETDVLPFVSQVDNIDPFYTVVGILTELIVNAQDQNDGSVATKVATLSIPNEIKTIDLALESSEPTIVNVTPNDGATGIVLSSAVSIQFNRSMDLLTVNDASFTLSTDEESIAGSVTLVADRKTAIFQAQQVLSDEKLYTINIASNVKDDFGNSLSGNQSDQSFKASFTTQDVTPPQVSLPGNISVSIPDNGKVTVMATQGTVEPGVTVSVVDEKNGLSTSVISDEQGGFELFLAATVESRLSLIVNDAAGNQTRLDGLRMEGEGAAVIGMDGGIIELDAGEKITFPSGTFPSNTLVRVIPVSEPNVSQVHPPIIGKTLVIDTGGVRVPLTDNLRAFSPDIPLFNFTVDTWPLKIVRELHVPENSQPGNLIRIMVSAKRDDNRVVRFEVSIPVVDSTANYTTREITLKGDNPVVIFKLPTTVVPGDIVELSIQAFDPDILITIPLPVETVVSEGDEFYLAAIGKVNNIDVVSVVDTARIITLADGSKAIQNEFGINILTSLMGFGTGLGYAYMQSGPAGSISGQDFALAGFGAASSLLFSGFTRSLGGGVTSIIGPAQQFLGAFLSYARRVLNGPRTWVRRGIPFDLELQVIDSSEVIALVSNHPPLVESPTTFVFDTSDNIPPVVTGVTPDIPRRLGPVDTIKIAFSEALEPTSVNTDSVRMRKEGETELTEIRVEFDSLTNEILIHPVNALSLYSKYVVGLSEELRDQGFNSIPGTYRFVFRTLSPNTHIHRDLPGLPIDLEVRGNQLYVLDKSGLTGFETDNFGQFARIDSPYTSGALAVMNDIALTGADGSILFGDFLLYLRGGIDRFSNLAILDINTLEPLGNGNLITCAIRYLGE